jgi:hypothetical protein
MIRYAITKTRQGYALVKWENNIAQLLINILSFTTEKRSVH